MHADPAPTAVPPDAPFPGEPQFDAFLTPHRSLGPRGFLVLMVTLCAVSFVAGLACVLAGAWPVFGFFGLDVALIYVAFRVNYRRARMYERVRVSPGELRVDKVSHHGRRRCYSFQPQWVRIELERPVEPDTPLHLTSHGRRLPLGSFLSAAEREDFARALGQALAEARRPQAV